MIRNNNALERLAFCKDLCIQVNHKTIDSPFKNLLDTKVTVRLLSQIEKRHLITMLVTIADENLVDDIDSVCMTGAEFIELTGLSEEHLDCVYSLLDLVTYKKKEEIKRKIEKV